LPSGCKALWEDGQIFGIEGLTEKMSGVIGPITYGAIATFAGYRPALIFLFGLFVVGIILLQRVPSKRAKRLLIPRA
ncbi:MFS transporter, partial [Patescibacteria group bacterium]|nr:MFS transporter [Patescibacteria group bacterium]